MNVSNAYCFSGSGDSFNIKEKNITDESCNICIDVFSADLKIAETPCKHLFHVACLKEWLNTNIGSRKIETCPTCRSHIGAITSGLNKLESERKDNNSAAQNMLQRAKADIENMLQGRSHASAKYILEDLEFASQHGLSAESLPLGAKVKLERAKTDIENMLQGRSHASAKYILEDLEFASQHGLSAESLPLEAKVKLERAKTDIQNMLQGRSHASAKYILEDLEFASQYGYSGEAQILVETMNQKEA
ncbi:RING finger protein [Endozoicomonas numazuensis]|uniref:RING-type domain-containing protein n=1 Tax=Endozoicomonas numazuensis TaxID=1137799 RepID=A0A081NF60_9GAMM|nr:RING-H2 finger protein [Endozoicomonas numazuensis]KEQ17083.1 hypothetical protein GZ78_14435 [Endozoicomonas numazuensis]